jgi:hypothetical protein
MTFDSIASYNRGLHHFGLIGKPDVDVRNNDRYSLECGVQFPTSICAAWFVTDTNEQTAILTCRLTSFVMSHCANCCELSHCEGP